MTVVTTVLALSSVCCDLVPLWVKGNTFREYANKKLFEVGLAAS